MKRPTLKGKGREIFFPESQRQDVEPPRQRNSTTSQRRAIRAPKQPPVKVTLWFPEKLVGELDHYWIKVRTKDRKITKSRIVSGVLERFLSGKRDPR